MPNKTFAEHCRFNRDEIINVNEFLVHSSPENSILYDFDCLAEKIIEKPNQTLEEFERNLWKSLLGGIKSNDQDLNNATERFFNLTPSFVNVLKELPLNNFKYVLEPLICSFTIPYMVQQKLIAFIRTHDSYPTEETDINTTKLNFWLTLVNIVNDVQDRYGLASLRLGLNEEIVKYIRNHSISEVLAVLLHVIPEYDLKLRCSEDIVANILYEKDVDEIIHYRLLKLQQCISAYGEDNQAITAKISALKNMEK